MLITWLLATMGKNIFPDRDKDAVPAGGETERGLYPQYIHKKCQEYMLMRYGVRSWKIELRALSFEIIHFNWVWNRYGQYRFVYICVLCLWCSMFAMPHGPCNYQSIQYTKDCQCWPRANSICSSPNNFFEALEETRKRRGMASLQ